MGTMNESEARRAALTAAVAWCSRRGTTRTETMLEHAEQFETWLTRPSVSAWSAVACPCHFRSKTEACSSCGHDAHDAGTCGSTIGYTTPAPVVLIPEERARPCGVCEHGEHDQSLCSADGCTCLASRAVPTSPTNDMCPECEHKGHEAHLCLATIRTHDGYSESCSCVHEAPDVPATPSPVDTCSDCVHGTTKHTGFGCTAATGTGPYIICPCERAWGR